MADKILCEKSDLVAVANAIRSKNGTTNNYKVNQLANAVENIKGGSLQNESVTFEFSGSTNKEIRLFYVGTDNNYHIVTKDPSVTSLIINDIIKNSIIIVSANDGLTVLSTTGLTFLESFDYSSYAYQINANASFSWSSNGPGKG